MKWQMEGLGTAWRSRYEYGYAEPASYVAVAQKWVLRWRGRKLWTRWKTVGEITINQHVAAAPFGESVLTPEQIAKFSLPNVRVDAPALASLNSTRDVVAGCIPRLVRILIHAVTICGEWRNHFVNSIWIRAWPIAKESQSAMMADIITDIAVEFNLQIRITVRAPTDSMAPGESIDAHHKPNHCTANRRRCKIAHK